MDMDDARLVERSRHGDVRAFDALVRRHLRGAYGVALAILGDPADADDVCQESFLTALKRLEDCREPARFGGWLRQIVRNESRDLLRSRRVRRALPLEAAVELPGDGSPLIDAERAELRERLVEGLAALDPNQRAVLLLHDLEGWRHREIAELLELPEGSVRAVLFHARRTMRPLLKPLLRTEEAHGS